MFMDWKKLILSRCLFALIYRWTIILIKILTVVFFYRNEKVDPEIYIKNTKYLE